MVNLPTRARMNRLRVSGSIFLVNIALTSDAFAQTGTGLAGKYDDDQTFASSRTDATVKINFGTAIPNGATITAAATSCPRWRWACSMKERAKRFPISEGTSVTLLGYRPPGF